MNQSQDCVRFGRNPKYPHIMTVLHSLHSLSTEQWIQFKICLSVRKVSHFNRLTFYTNKYCTEATDALTLAALSWHVASPVELLSWFAVLYMDLITEISAVYWQEKTNCDLWRCLSFQITCFNNEEVEKAVMEGLAEAGVRVHSGYILSQWKYYGEGQDVTSVLFTSDGGDPVQIECSVSKTLIPQEWYELFRSSLECQS